MGVPILRGGRVLGVLVVQNRTQRHYTEDESRGAADHRHGAGRAGRQRRARQPVGAAAARTASACCRCASRACASTPDSPRHGRAARAAHRDPPASSPRIRRPSWSVCAARSMPCRARSTSCWRRATSPAAASIATSSRPIACSPPIAAGSQRIAEAVHSGLTAEAAVQKVQDETRARMSQVSDPYLRERLADLEDLGQSPAAASRRAPRRPRRRRAARRNSSSSRAAWGRPSCSITTAGGSRRWCSRRARPPRMSPSSRARSTFPSSAASRMCWPRSRPATSSSSMATKREVLLRPGEDIQQAVDARIELRLGQRLSYAALRDLPAETRDGDARRAACSMPGCCSICLSRRDRRRRHRPLPHRAAVHAARRLSRPSRQQAALYRRVLEHAGDRPVTFRTLDIGGDKLLPYMSEIRGRESGDGLARHPHRARPAGAAAPAAARADPRRARPPAARHVPDDRRGRRVRRGARGAAISSSTRSAARGHELPAKIEVGVMLEVPALLWQLPQLLPHGRFPLGRHQRSGAVPLRRRPRQSAARRALRHAVAAGAARCSARWCAACAEHRVPLSAVRRDGGRAARCHGAGRLGFRALSMAPAAIGPVKAMIRSLDARAARRAARHATGAAAAQPARQAARFRPRPRRRRITFRAARQLRSLPCGVRF